MLLHLGQLLHLGLNFNNSYPEISERIPQSRFIYIYIEKKVPRKNLDALKLTMWRLGGERNDLQGSEITTT